MATMTHRQRGLTTIRDVAAAAGVSIGTASKALRGQGSLRDETRLRVREAADRLGFRPNDLAQSLHRKKSFTVGLLSNDSYGRFTIPLLEGIEQSLASAGVSVFVCNAFDDTAREEKLIDSLLSKRVDGIIVTSRRTDPRTAVDLHNAGVPLLYAFTRVQSEEAFCLVPDDLGGARLGVEHLIKNGRRRIAHISGPERFESVRLRRDAYQAVLQEHGLPHDSSKVLIGAWSESWGHEAVAKLFGGGATGHDIDAIFCGSDQIARGVVDALRERGVRVPQDVAIVGFDNWEIVAAATRPPLTTIDMNLQELGREAGSAVLSMIDGGHRTGTIRIPCKLVVRDSCGGRAS
ncbi:MAG TPA: LacI family DNA-binding transcriptional regulator [Magnetospirillaceae bacterium]|jgi:LacI family transcriptional regulator